jgi:hypothetical protein
MYCQELDRLLDQHSALTMELFRQDGRTQGWYHTIDEWERECAKLRAMEEELERLISALAAHRRQHGCVADLATEATKEREVCSVPEGRHSAGQHSLP